MEQALLSDRHREDYDRVLKYSQLSNRRLGTYVDVGVHSLRDCFLFVQNNEKYIGFEADPMYYSDICQHFSKVMSRTSEGVFINKTLSDQVKTVKFYRSNNYHGYGSLNQNWLQNSGLDHRLTTLKLKTTTLDRELGDAHVDILSIDTEGHDAHVIMGAKNLITRCLPLIIAEHLNHMSRPFLTNLGYTFIKDSDWMCIPPNGENYVT